MQTRFLAALPLLLGLALPAQTKPCQSAFAAGTGVRGLVHSRAITSTGNTVTQFFAYKITAPSTVLAQGMRYFTGNQFVGGASGVSIWSHDAKADLPSKQLATGSFWMKNGAANAWRGANFDRPVLMIKNTVYWVGWTPLYFSQVPYDNGATGTAFVTARKLGPTGTWVKATAPSRVKYQIYCSLLDNKSTKAVGVGCKDSSGATGTAFVNEEASVGNINFIVQGTGLPPGASCLLYVGVQKKFTPVDLTSFGAPACFLRTDILYVIPGKTGTTALGSPTLAAGQVVYLPAGVPNNTALKGLFLRGQIAAADANSKNPLKAVFTNAIEVTLR